MRTILAGWEVCVFIGSIIYTYTENKMRLLDSLLRNRVLFLFSNTLSFSALSDAERRHKAIYKIIIGRNPTAVRNVGNITQVPSVIADKSS